MRRTARHAGLDLSVRALLDELANISEPSCSTKATKDGPAPTACSPGTTPQQDKLAGIFSLDRYTPRR